MSKNEIAIRIKELREKRGISASEFARLVGVTPTAVWNWEKNSITPRRPALESIAKVLGVTTDFLLGGKGREVTASPVTVSVASVLEEAKARLAEVTGFTPDRIKLSVQFATE